jgi:hypothetical protein
MSSTGRAKRFDVAFSLAGEQREVIAPIAVELERRGLSVFFYAWPRHVAELAKPNLDVQLRRIYGDEARLLIPVLSSDYARKPWTGVVELTVVRELIFSRRDDEIMVFRADEAGVEGFSILHGYVDIRGRPTAELADLIEARVHSLGVNHPHGRVQDLMNGASESNPGNRELQAIRGTSRSQDGENDLLSHDSNDPWLVREPSPTSTRTGRSKPADDTFEIHLPRGGRSFLDQPFHLFLADAGFDGLTGAAVVSCVIVADAGRLERQWAREVESMLEDPQLRAVAGITDAIWRRQFGFLQTDSALRDRVARMLQGLIFEAYVAFTRERASVDQNYERLVRAVVFDRLRAQRGRNVQVTLTASDESRRSRASSVVTSSADEVRRLHKDASPTGPPLVQSTTRSPGATIAEYVAEIVRDRVDRGTAAEMFALVYPNKLRVLYDMDADRYYTRRDPFDR